MPPFLTRAPSHFTRGLLPSFEDSITSPKQYRHTCPSSSSSLPSSSKSFLVFTLKRTWFLEKMRLGGIFYGNGSPIYPIGTRSPGFSRKLLAWRENVSTDFCLTKHMKIWFYVGMDYTNVLLDIYIFTKESSRKRIEGRYVHLWSFGIS